MAEAVKVAVRVRPFNQREISRKATVIINMIGNSTEITDPDNPKATPKRFAFDYSYWSHDEYKEQPNGYLEPVGGKYADQKRVFDDLGRGVLENAWNGYNCSLFAYGQTGSGKSYSMVGYGTNKVFVPCQQRLDQHHRLAAPCYQVLRRSSCQGEGNSLGVEACDEVKVVVSKPCAHTLLLFHCIVPISCEELFKEIEIKRSTAVKGEEYQVTYSMMEIYNEQVRDLLNPASLKVKGGLKVRQHPKQGFYVEQLKAVPVHSYSEIDKKMTEGTKNRTVASTNMNATSSRAHTIVGLHFTQKKVNDSGKSMTKTSVINLVDLAGSERADSTGATGDRLKEGANINKSLSTLGNCIKALADQSQGKKGIIVPFRDSVLTKLLMNALGGNSKTIMIAALSPAHINYDETLSTLRFADRAKAVKTVAVVNESPTDKLIRELREENEKLKKLLESGGIPASGSGGGDGGSGEDAEIWKQQLEANKNALEEMEQSWEEKWAQREKELLSELEVEKKQKDKENTVPHLSNLNEDPALTGKIIHLLDKKVKIGCAKNGKAPDITLVGLGIVPKHAEIQNKNGVLLIPEKGRVLLNGTIITSKKQLKNRDRVMFGNTNLFLFIDPKVEKRDSPLPSFEDAQTEIAKNSGLNKLAGNGKSQEDLLLMEDLVQIWPMLGNANSMSEEMDKKIKFEIILVSPQARGEKHGRTQVFVKLKNLATKNEFMWDRDTFLNRYYMMQEMYQNFVDGENISAIAKVDDPFWEDPSTEMLIGCVHVYLQSLAYMIDMKEKLQITDFKGQNQGQLDIEIFPCTKDGKEIVDDFVDDPNELVGKEMHVIVKILQARGIPKKFKMSFCRYKFYLDDQPMKSAEGTGINPEYQLKKQLSFTPITKQFIEYLESEPLVIEVWGRQEPRPENSELTTEELMLKDKNKVNKPQQEETDDEDTEDMLQIDGQKVAELAMYKRRLERAENKVKKALAVVQKAKKNNQKMISVEEMEKVLSSGSRLKAVANIIIQTEKIKRATDLGQNVSQACSLQ
ncbi:hypothetical protein LSH36_1080g00009 [Paralvinella palmiformis]|uniref:Kinesin motor domain-containing protein n=1 Tax=Paralvinella palmiformis TaxID=53620 RepID=A0AAD9IVX5_9ANNE|nr:hypothetical protein LSH36_1080g00009 [Paralvinella palmiformis]